MLRALFKTAVMWPIGQLPRGPELYHAVTCGLLGSQAFHPPKLANAWRRYAVLLRDPCGLECDGLPVWVHECGWTPISALTSYLVTGKAAILTNTHARVLDRYLALSVEKALGMKLEGADVAPQVLEERRATLCRTARASSAQRVVEALGGRIFGGVDAAVLPLPSESVGFCHSGNALEHYAPAALRMFLRECWRVLLPGGVASHVFDHRDHLHHVDRSWPFLFHRVLPDKMYQTIFGHPLLYHNRLGPRDVMRLFEEAGFEPILVRRAGVDFRYVCDEEVLRQPLGLPAWARERAQDLSELDLRTAYAHYLYRKPDTRASRSA